MWQDTSILGVRHFRPWGKIVRHLGPNCPLDTLALSRQLGCTKPVLKCLGSKLSWVKTVWFSPITTIIIQLSQPRPWFANRSQATVESGWTLVTMVTCDKSRMITLFCIDSVNQSPVRRSTLTGWLHDITVNQSQFGYAYRMRLR